MEDSLDQFKKPIINNSTPIITKNIKNSNNDAALIPAGQFHGGF